MPDKFSKQIRSKIMSSIRSRNTQPEITIRKILWSHGKRYRIHDRSVYGTPDISFKNERIAIFIDGCFWHGCKKCYVPPKTNEMFWRNKMIENRKRRGIVTSRLENDGWRILSFWEHEIKNNPQKVVKSILKFFKASNLSN